MNGLSPQATFKPSPSPRYPGNMGGRGRGAHRRNPSTHPNNHSESGALAHSPAFSHQQQSSNNSSVAPVGGSATAASNANNSNSANGVALSNGPSAALLPSKNSSSSQAGTTSVSTSSTSTTNNNTGGGSGRDSKEASTSHHPLQKQATDGAPAAVGTGYGPASGDERRHHPEVNNERNFGKFKLFI